MMDDSSSNCSVGLVKEEICHKQTYIKEIGVITFKDIEYRKAINNSKIWNSNTY